MVPEGMRAEKFRRVQWGRQNRVLKDGVRVTPNNLTKAAGGCGGGHV